MLLHIPYIHNLKKRLLLPICQKIVAYNGAFENEAGDIKIVIMSFIQTDEFSLISP